MAFKLESQTQPTASKFGLDETLHSLGLDIAEPEEGSACGATKPNEDAIRNSKVMIVDDEAYNVLVVRRFLQHTGYTNFVTTTEPARACDLMKTNLPDVLLLDITMPEVGGLEILRTMKMDPQLAAIPVIILAAAPEVSVKTQALQLGAADFLAKPVEPVELVLRVRNVLAAKAHFQNLASYSMQLERQVHERTAELVRSREQIIFCLARAAEFRDNETGHHVVRVGRYAGVIAAEMGFTTRQVEAIELAAQLHDVGKIGIPDAILHKPGNLDPEEFAFVQRHCGFGNQIISRMPDKEWNIAKQHTELGRLMVNVETSPIMRMASRIALTHHEWWNGAGYPLGLEGEDIPIEGRITAVADVFDALSSRRSYKKAFSRKKCFEMLEEKRDSQFDPQVLDAFYRRSEEIVEIQLRYADAE